MAYVKKTSIARDYMIEKYYYTGRYHPKGERRGKKMQPSPESVKKANEKRAEEDLLLKLNMNFGIDDYWVTLTYAEGNKTRTLEEMRDDIRKFLRDVKKEYQKLGQELKFVYVLRVGKRGSRHFHLVMNKIEDGRKIIEKHWHFGYPKTVHIYARKKNWGTENEKRLGTFDKIANYMIEESELTRTVFKDENIKRYSPSRNLEKPIVEKVIIKRSNTFRKKPRVPKGWELLEDSDSTDAYGHICYEFRCLRIRN